MTYHILTIDSLALDKMKKATFRVHSIFQNVLNVAHKNELIIFANETVTKRPNLVAVDQITDFQRLDIKIGTIVRVHQNEIEIGNHQFLYKNAYHWKFQELVYIPLTIPKVMKFKEEIIDFLQTQSKLNYYNFKDNIEKQSMVDVYKFTQINRFKDAPNMIHAERLIGLGEGLTPHGDDVLAGYIFAKNLYREDKEFNQHVLKQTRLKSNIISYSMIDQIVHHQYSDDFKQLAYAIQNGSNEEQAIQTLADFGATSGLAILSGVAFGLEEVGME